MNSFYKNMCSIPTRKTFSRLLWQALAIQGCCSVLGLLMTTPVWHVWHNTKYIAVAAISIGCAVLSGIFAVCSAMSCSNKNLEVCLQPYLLAPAFIFGVTFVSAALGCVVLGMELPHKGLPTILVVGGYAQIIAVSMAGVLVFFLFLFMTLPHHCRQHKIRESNHVENNSTTLSVVVS